MEHDDQPVDGMRLFPDEAMWSYSRGNRQPGLSTTAWRRWTSRLGLNQRSGITAVQLVVHGWYTWVECWWYVGDICGVSLVHTEFLLQMLVYGCLWWFSSEFVRWKI